MLKADWQTTLEQKLVGKIVDVWTIRIFKDLTLSFLSPSVHIEA